MPLFQQSVISNPLPVPKGSEVIGWRLATQESITSFHFKDAAFSPAVLSNSTSQGQSSCLFLLRKAHLQMCPFTQFAPLHFTCYCYYSLKPETGILILLFDLSIHNMIYIYMVNKKGRY